MLFFTFGFITWLNGSLIPFFKAICRLSNTQALLVTFAFYISYFVLALPLAGVLARIGYRAGMALGLAAMAAGCLGFIPAALTASYPLFLAALLAIGGGLTILQTASNPYLVLLGPPATAPRRIAIMGILNKAAGFLAPLAFVALVRARLPALDHAPTAASARAMARQLIAPYAGMALGLAALAALVLAARLPEVTAPAATRGMRLRDHPRVWGAAAVLFLYVGVEVIAGDTIALFGRQLGVARYAGLTSYTMAFMVLGYVVGIASIPRFVRPRAALLGSAAFGLACVAGIELSQAGSTALSGALWGWSGPAPLPDPVAFVALMGAANALVWPSLWPIALEGVGAVTPRASALLVMAISGGAVLPLAFGWVADHAHGMASAYWLAVPCYLAIGGFALVTRSARSDISRR